MSTRRPSPAPPRLHVLATADTGLAGTVLHIGPEGVVLGRAPGCDVVVTDPSVSRRHAEIRPSGGGWELRDLGSSNGTWIGERRVDRALLADGLEFRLGTARFRFEVPPPPPAPPGPPPERSSGEPGQRPRTGIPEPSAEPPSAPEAPPAAARPRVPEPESVFEVFEVEGDSFEATGNRPFLLADPASVWYVASGKVEVFTVGVEDGRPRGARNHFVTVEQGGLLVGMDPALFAGGSGFLAVGTIGTTLRRLPRARFRELARRPPLAAQVGELVDRWVAALSSGLTGDIVPPPMEEISLLPSETARLLPSQRALSGRGVLWIEARSGELLFIDMEELDLEEIPEGPRPGTGALELGDLVRRARGERVLFPVSTHTWISAVDPRGEGATVLPHPSAEVVDREAFWRGLDAFHHVLCRCEFINKRLSAVDELNRLRSKAEYARAARLQAIQDLAGVLAERKKPGTPQVTATGDAVFEAVRLVAEAAGITARKHPEGAREKTFDGMVAAIAKASRFRTRAVALREEWWKLDAGPLLGRRSESGDPVALLPTGPTSYECVDPKAGTREPVTDELVATLAPFGITFYRPFPEGELSAWDLMKFGIRGLKHDVGTLLLMGIGLGILGTLTPIFTGKLFDTAIPQADRSLLLQYTTGLFLAALVSAAFKITQSIAVLRIQGRMDYSIQAALWDRLLDLPSTFFRRFSAGDLADRAGGIARIRDLIAGAGISAILGSMSSVFYVFLMFKYSLPLALLAMALTLFFVGFTTTANYLQLRLQRDHMRLQGRITGMVLQFISGVSKLRVAGAENHAFRVWAREFSLQRKLEFAIGRIQNAVSVFASGFPVLSSMAIFYVLVALRRAAQAEGAGGPAGMSTGEFIAFTAAYGAFSTAIQALGEASLNLLRIVPIFERLKPILVTEPEIDETKAYPGTLKGAIEIANVHFRYSEDGPWILQGISLSIEPGEFVAFVGSSGSGKSTLMRLMLGFETPDRGAIYYDGQDLASLDVREVRQQLGVVLQDAKVLPADIFRNIVGASDLTLEDAWEAARMAGLADDIKELPMGMHTYVSEGGGGFSGGQLQRLLIARALVRKPRILFFDEATSALDNRSQAIVTESMERLFATRIVIAHRLSTIVNADRICYLDRGRLAESGTFEELMELDGLFAALARRQMA